jgi:hypothetical protein
MLCVPLLSVYTYLPFILILHFMAGYAQMTNGRRGSHHHFFYFVFHNKIGSKVFFCNSTLNSHSNLTMDNFLLTIAVVAVHHFITLIVNWQSTM